MSAKAFKKLPVGVVRATKEHMPFAGHRSCATWFSQSAPRPSDPAARRARLEEAEAIKFGFDPVSLKASAR